MIMRSSGARRPFGRRAFVVATLAAVLGGLSGIALGSWLAWRAVPVKAPDAATAISVARTVLPGPFEEQVNYYGRSTFWNPFSENTLHGGTGVRAGRAGVTGAAGGASAIEQHMRAHGWHDISAGTAEVTGERDGYLAVVQLATGRLDLMWAEPPGHRRDTILGGVAGALLGAALGLVTAQRIRRYGPRRQRVYSWLCVSALVLLTPACLGNIPTSTGSLLANTNREGTGPSVYWGGFVIWGAEPLALLSPVPILALLAVSFWPPGSRAFEIA
ncbi:hypothetical protein [Actinoplanes sp. NPDC048796]|uniref:hypothetical protein n=1 Tax=Actinoplanes sp. NPDC048796 TaxID=3155640 RepID=UPI0033CA037E